MRRKDEFLGRPSSRPWLPRRERSVGREMDDELEDEVLLQVYRAHTKLFSKLLLSFPINSGSFSYMARYFRYWFLRTEVIALSVALLAVILLCHSADLWYKNVLKKLQFVTGVQRDRLKVFAGPSSKNDRRSWELQRENAGVYALQGRRSHMEDRFAVLTDEETGISLYGIFDGHGGESAAEFAEKHLFPTLLKKLQEAKNSNSKPPEKVSFESKEQQQQQQEEKETESSMNQDNNTLNTDDLISVFSKLLTEEILAVDKKLLSLAKASNDVAGSTALVAILYGMHLIVANVGDSRGVVCDSKGQAIPLSFDHKPQQLKEHKRIKEAGGFITFTGVWRVAGILATSRALGDFPLKERNLVIAEPDILSFDLKDIKAQFMILATDGLWDAFSNEEAVSFVREHVDEPLLGARSIVLQAYHRGSLDNISVIVVDFRKLLNSTGNEE